jgi:hypothetical protein
VTATNATRKARGQRTQNLVARWFAGNGWPHAESTGAGRTGSDVTGIPGLACEVKARAGLDPLAWIKQARTGGPGLPFVVFRCNGQGEQLIGEWPVLLRLAEFTTLLQAAGYGDGELTPDVAAMVAPITEADLGGVPADLGSKESAR